jgi:hypothetical protein
MRRSFTILLLVGAVMGLAGCASVSGTYDGYRTSGVRPACESTKADHALVEVTLQPLKSYTWLGSINAEGDSVHVDRVGVVPAGFGIREGESPLSAADLNELLKPGNDDDNPFESFQQVGLRAQPAKGPFTVLMDIHWGSDSARLTAFRLHWSPGEPAFLQHLKVSIRRADCS